MKKSLAASILSILLIGFASAQFYSGYNNFSPRGGVMDLFDPGTIIYGGIFIIAFSLLFFSLSKIFKDSAGNPSKATAGTISFAISAMATYGIYWSRWDPTSFLSAGLFNGVAGSIIPLVVLVALILMIWKLKFANSMITIGLLLLGLTFTNSIDEKGTVAVIGILLLIVGIFTRSRTARGVAAAGAARKPTWAATGIGAVLLVLGLFTGIWWLILIGIIVVAVGMFGKKAKETGQNIAAGRVFSAEKAENEARAEKARRERGQQQVEARRMDLQIRDVQRRISGIEGDITKYRADISTAVDKKQRATIQNEIMRLEREKRELQTEIDRLKQG